MADKIADFVFNPWRELNGTRVKTSEAYWRKPLKWNREAGMTRADWAEAHRVPRRPRVLCGVEVFEDWQGPVMDHNGQQLMHVHGGGIKPAPSSEIAARWLDAPSSYGGAVRPVTLDDLRRDLFALIDATPNLDWMIRTKHPENVRRMWPGMRCSCGSGSLDSGQHPIDCTFRQPRRANCWLGCSVSDQATSDAAIPELLKCRDLCQLLSTGAATAGVK